MKLKKSVQMNRTLENGTGIELSIRIINYNNADEKTLRKILRRRALVMKQRAESSESII